LPLKGRYFFQLHGKFDFVALRVRTKINSQILSVEAPAGQGAKAQEYQEYFELLQRRQAGCIGA